MTPEQIALVKDSFARILPMKATVAAAFYDRLFRLDPSLKLLFGGDLEAQGDKLMMAIGRVVAALDHFDTIATSVRALARRHLSYGAQDSHYATVGTALLDTLEDAFAKDFTPELRMAWATAYSVLSNAMIEAARTAPRAA